jgi:hypothetical protein
MNLGKHIVLKRLISGGLIVAALSCVRAIAADGITPLPVTTSAAQSRPNAPQQKKATLFGACEQVQRSNPFLQAKAILPRVNESRIHGRLKTMFAVAHECVLSLRRLLNIGINAARARSPLANGHMGASPCPGSI